MERAERDKTVPMEIESLFSEQRVVLRETRRAVTPYGDIAVWMTHLRKIGFVDQVRRLMPIQLRSHNQIDPTATLTSFLVSVALGGRRFSHVSAIRNDNALQSLLGLSEAAPDGS